MKLFDAHCHLQDPRIYPKSHQIIISALDSGVEYISVNGVSEKDWELVKEMSQTHPSVLPSFGLHPWFINGRSSNWLNDLKEQLEANPEASVGEIGLDKGPWANHADYDAQIEVFSQQIALAKKLNRPASVHCVDAFVDLLHILKSTGPFPAGFIMHSYIGSGELVPDLATIGAYFSISGHLMPMEESKAKEMLRSVPLDRLLLETDSPDALPKNQEKFDSPKEEVNQPANIRYVLSYVATLLEMNEEEIAQISYRNAMRIFSFEGSKVSS